MSYQWSFTANNNSNGLIEKIYCSYISMSIPLEYYWTVLFKDGTEKDFEDIIELYKNGYYTDLVDINAIEQTKMNIHLLNNIV
jgi:hypothetical protein